MLETLDASDLVKMCCACGETKPASAFFVDKRRRYPASLRARCRECTKDDTRVRRTANPEIFRAWERQAKARHFHADGPRRRERNRHYTLKYKFGITIDEFCQKLSDQGGRCAICQTPIIIMAESKDRRLTACVDHDHETGAVRGLLCHACNSALGQMGDDPGRLELAAAYLRAHGK